MANKKFNVTMTTKTRKTLRKGDEIITATGTKWVVSVAKLVLLVADADFGVEIWDRDEIEVTTTGRNVAKANELKAEGCGW